MPHILNRPVSKAIFYIGLLILFAMFESLSSSLYAQTLKYQVIWKGDSIGYIIAKRTLGTNHIDYHIKTEASVSFVFDFKMITDFTTQYENGILKHASTKSKLNKKDKHFSNIRKEGNTYAIETEKGTSQFRKLIKESVVSMYFNEPKGQEIFSERYGKMCEIEKTETGKYDLRKPDGRINSYYFKDGVCQGGKINLSLTSFIFQKIN